MHFSLVVQVYGMEYDTYLYKSSCLILLLLSSSTMCIIHRLQTLITHETKFPEKDNKRGVKTEKETYPRSLIIPFVPTACFTFRTYPLAVLASNANVFVSERGLKPSYGRS